MNGSPTLKVFFFRTGSGVEPVRDWLRSLGSKDDRKAIGEDIMVVQSRWPLGMPWVRKMEPDLWEVRSHLPNGRIARVFFTVKGHDMVLLHGFEKKSRHTPREDLELARKRKSQYFGELHNEQA